MKKIALKLLYYTSKHLHHKVFVHLINHIIRFVLVFIVHVTCEHIGQSKECEARGTEHFLGIDGSVVKLIIMIYLNTNILIRIYFEHRTIKCASLNEFEIK